MQTVMPVAVTQEIESSFIEDKFRHLTGPVNIPKEFTDELHRIDDRLVLRWQPRWGLYAVFCRMQRSDRLWSQPVHIVWTENKGFRKPGRRDLEAIRKANWFAKRNGARAAIDRMDQAIADQHVDDQANFDRQLRESVTAATRRHNLTYRDIGVTRKAVTKGGRER